MMVVLLVADAIAVTGAVVVALLGTRDNVTLRYLRLGGVAVSGGLVAIVALRVGHHSAFASVVLILFALLPAPLLWIVVVDTFNPLRGRLQALLTPVVLVVVLVPYFAFRSPQPAPLTVEERDTTRFGLPVKVHHYHVPSKVVDHLPTVADADAGVQGGTAVPVRRYAVDGTVLTLVVLHHGLCGPAAVVLAPAGGDVDVLVAYTEFPSLASSNPAGPRTKCKVDATDLFALHSALAVDLPAGLTVTTVHDAGAEGEARLVP